MPRFLQFYPLTLTETTGAKLAPYIFPNTHRKTHTMKNETTYNGWTNYETWNVSCWASSTEFLYALARTSEDYRQFVELVKMFANDITNDYYARFNIAHNFANGTPDGINWKSRKLNTQELDEMIKEM